MIWIIIGFVLLGGVLIVVAMLTAKNMKGVDIDGEPRYNEPPKPSRDDVA